MVYPALFAMIVGVLMLGQWIFCIGAHQVPELATEPVRLRLHIGAELLTAAALLLTGGGLLLGSSTVRALYPVAIGMLLYTVIVSPGYFAQKRVWPLVGMFQEKQAPASHRRRAPAFY
jgi:hypothetical protein